MRKRVIIAIVLLVALTTIGFTTYRYIAGTLDAVRDYYGLAFAGDLLELHLLEDDCRWPDSWDDVELTLAESYPDNFDHLRDRVSVEWMIDPCAALSLKSERPLLIHISDAPEESLRFSDHLYDFLARECCRGADND